NCGSSDLDVDPARGDTVCTNCGTVLEDSVIVSEMQFEENAHGGTSALGHFVSSDSKGGCQGFGGALRGGLNRESREITLDNCKRNISSLCNQLRLNQHCLETSFNLYKMALSRNLTKGRRQILVCAACVYMTCRLEGTSHLLIDFSELLQICIFELGRTYLRLSQALCISIPSMDPCLYVLRYSNRLDFGAKTHEVTMTALRILQRMKKDMLHSGRRPNGLIGAAVAGDDYIKSNELPRVIKECLEDADLEEETEGEIRGIGPTPAMLGMATNQDAERNDQIVDDAEDDLGDIDDEEINSYILTEGEATNKAKLWEVLNREYLTLQAERKAREEVEGKKEKKKRKPKANKATSVAKTAGEAIEKMLKEKKISTKINYDVLKSLDFTVDVNTGEMSTEQKSAPRIIENLEITSSIKKTRAKPTKEKREPTPKTPPKVKVEKPITKKEIKEEVIKQEVDNARIDEYEDDYDFEEEKEEEEETLSSMFRRNVDEEEYDDY
ncbi:transcription factor IIIB 90 kDa subunit, partial [Diaphorina citri]|uniref:B-related factor 1 n=1 Tax=Diaphorina citri TaxID=121845 RepID=A0A3Q0IHL6_DIACI